MAQDISPSSAFPRHVKRIGLIAALGSLALFSGAAMAKPEPALTINGLTPRAYLEQMFADCFTHPTETPRASIDKYLTLDAVHVADGKPVSREEHIHHLEYLQKNIASISFDIQQVAFDGEWLAERHVGRTILKDGKEFDSEVAVFFHLKGGKVDRSFEITRPLSGDEADRAIHTAR